MQKVKNGLRKATYAAAKLDPVKGQTIEDLEEQVCDLELQLEEQDGEYNDKISDLENRIEELEGVLGDVAGSLQDAEYDIGKVLK